MDLFAEQEREALEAVKPLPVRMRPRSLDEFVGQTHVLGEGRPLRRLLETDSLTSVVIWGPAGCGKTTFARVVAAHTHAYFVTLHAAESGVRDVRRVGEEARGRLTAGGQRTVLFLDEIHRFNRAQQDSLLRDVEEGVFILLGATTENPYAVLNTPLISRSRVFEFQPLSPEEMETLIRRALADEQRGLGPYHAQLDADALARLIRHADGDARRGLAGLEAAVLGAARREGPVRVSVEDVAESLQRKNVPYDLAGDVHYDVASALIKSMRGSDVDASLYWLARMLEGGEDPMFIARRIAILASEDVGNADPQALTVAASMLKVVQSVGLPECQLVLAQAVIYMACAPKSNAVTTAIAAARADVRDQPTLPVPPHLQDQTYRPRGPRPVYAYPHDAPEGVLPQDYLGAQRVYYNPSSRGFEAQLAERLAHLRRVLRGGSSGESPGGGGSDASRGAAAARRRAGGRKIKVDRAKPEPQPGPQPGPQVEPGD